MRLLFDRRCRWPEWLTSWRLFYHQVVLLSNSDIAFDESLARLGDPSTLDMDHKVKGSFLITRTTPTAEVSVKQEHLPPLG